MSPSQLDALSFSPDPAPPILASALRALQSDNYQSHGVDPAAATNKWISISLHSEPISDSEHTPLLDSDLVGGLTGYTCSTHLFITILATSLRTISSGPNPLHTRPGAGTALLAQAEKIALEEFGCTTSYLCTFDYLAEGFYLKQGYTRVAVVPGAYGGKSKRLWLSKDLSPETIKTHALEPLMKISKGTPDPDAALSELLRNRMGAAESAYDPTFSYNYKPFYIAFPKELHLAVSQAQAPMSTSPISCGMIGHFGASFLSIDRFPIPRVTTSDSNSNQDTSSAPARELAKRMLELAETEAKAPGQDCRGATCTLFSSEAETVSTLKDMGYNIAATFPGWFGGAVDQYLMYKEF